MKEDHIVHIDVEYKGDYEKHKVIPELGISKDILSDAELEVLELINEKFKNFGSVAISEYAHKEKGYKATKKGEIISYAYAKDIELE